MSEPTNGNKMRVAIYARVSGEEQVTGRNIEQQIAQLEDDLPRSHRVVGIYKDDGVSGAKPLADRPEGARLMSDAAAGHFEQVVATRLDRIEAVGKNCNDYLASKPNPSAARRLCLTPLAREPAP